MVKFQKQAKIPFLSVKPQKHLRRKGYFAQKTLFQNENIGKNIRNLGTS